MEDTSIDVLTQRLQDTKLPPSGVSFAGKGLKLDSAEDAQQVVDAINACGNLEFLNLEGNTIGVDAAVAISKALELHSEFKYALWKDMFTGRLKEEIPKALKALCGGVMKAKAQLEILDLSDNASGPIGVDGIEEFIKSESCYTLKELRLNNMGLGITGAQMLSNALLDCCRNAESAGNPLKLKVFIAGRNRLEDEGITALSQIFRKIESLEELTVPQNGIYSAGIKALSDALSHNLALKKLNLNDNSLGVKGTKALANGLRNVRDLRTLDIGDCLVKNKGAFAIAEMLANAHNIQEVVLSYNSIRIDGALAILDALVSKKQLISVKLDGNKFGEKGKDIVISKVKEFVGNKDILDSLEEDEGSEEDEDDVEGVEDVCEEEEEEEEEEDDDDDYDEDDESESLYEEDDEDEEISGEEEEDIRNLDVVITEQRTSKTPIEPKKVTPGEFISDPILENLMGLGRNPGDKIIEEVKKRSDNISTQIEELLSIIMKVSSLLKAVKAHRQSRYEFSDEHKITLECTDRLYAEIFSLALRCNCLSTINNTLPVLLGLIKSEKKVSKLFDEESCIMVIKEAMKKDYFPKETSHLLEFMMSNKPLAMKKTQKGN